MTRGLPGFIRRSIRRIESDEESSSSLGESSNNPTRPETSNGSNSKQSNGQQSQSMAPAESNDQKESLDKDSTDQNRPDLPVPQPYQEEVSSSSIRSDSTQRSYKQIQFDKVLHADIVPMSQLRSVSWNGIPTMYRSSAWKIMLGYLPTSKARRQDSIRNKRAEYQMARRQYYDIDDDTRSHQEQETLRQVLVDVPRTAPEVPLFRHEKVRRILSRLLYIWAMRHPASSYVQGINDLATPLLVVFLSDYADEEVDVLSSSEIMDQITQQQLDDLEADVYWCLTNLLAGIQDHYTSDQPGVQRMVMRLEELVQRIDANLCQHLKETGIEFMQFSFKWMNCLLLREFKLKCVIRLWDTYISENNGFEDFHVYVCAAFLCQFSAKLQTMSFDELFIFMQDIPTGSWGDTEIEMLLSQAYVLSTLFKGSEAHLQSGGNQAR